jgi:hypothetical protein
VPNQKTSFITISSIRMRSGANANGKQGKCCLVFRQRNSWKIKRIRL